MNDNLYDWAVAQLLAAQRLALWVSYAGWDTGKLDELLAQEN